MNKHWETRCANGEYKKELERDTAETVLNFQEQVRVLTKNLKKHNPKTILEIGCGTGRITKILSEMFPDAEIIAIDLVQGNIDVCPKLLNVKYEQRDILANPLTKHYDMIVAVEVLMHLKDISILYKHLSIFSDVFIHIDFIRDWRRPMRHFALSVWKFIRGIPEHCFAHNYMTTNCYKTMYIEPIQLSKGFLQNYFEIK